MKTQYHRAITTQALSPCFSRDALETVIAANLGQDIWRYQFGHEHFHFDSNSFTAGNTYIEGLRRTIMDALRRGDAIPARQSFGRLIHAAQDFYAHSNYIQLWRESQPDATPGEIDPLLDQLLTDSRLRSGHIYYPLEVFSFIPRLRPLVLPLLPRDSHAWMNIDDPSRPNFDYAIAVAVKRTKLEFERLCQTLSMEQIHLFTEIANQKSQIANQKSKIKNQKIQNRKSKIQNRKSKGL